MNKTMVQGQILNKLGDYEWFFLLQMKSECSRTTSTNEELYYVNYDMKDFFIF
jgi:hypothetical protein